MKQSWDRIFEWIIKHEGGYVDHPDDPGGMTNLGVTRKVWSDWIKRDATEADMKALTKDDVKPLYKKWYFDKVRGDDMVSVVGVDAISTGGSPDVILHHADGSEECIPTQNTFSLDQFGWFKAGSALNQIRANA